VVRVVERPLPVVAEAPPAGEVVPFIRGVSLLDLGAQQCRWPVGDPSGDDFRFCGARTDAGETYCCSHGDLAFPGRQKKRKG
jgi:GcrA cell cycle regulator